MKTSIIFKKINEIKDFIQNFDLESILNTDQNPKLVGTNIVDCIPQTGNCPVGCPECFYNGGKFYRTLDKPLEPIVLSNKIVRVNSGHDSNINRKLVLKKTKHYKNKFYNTSFPVFDFPGPVVFTCNGGKNEEMKLIKPTKNLMFVRVRVAYWKLEEVDKAVDFYLKTYNTPVVLTFMRYYDDNRILEVAKDKYEYKKHILNSYYCLKQEAVLEVMDRYKQTGVRFCGTPVASNCLDCQNCEFLYWKCMRKLNG